MTSIRKSTARALGFTFMLALALVLLSPIGALAQEVTGSLKGTVVDQQNAIVPGASVTVKSQDKGTERSAIADSDGNFAIYKLNPGKYTLTVEKQGFKKKAVTDMSLNLGENSIGNVVLEAGTPTETVTVTAGTEEIVNRDQAQIYATFDS